MPKHKVLKSVANNFARSFTSTLNYVDSQYVMDHLFKAARQSGESKLHVNILDKTWEPDTLVTPSVKISLYNYCQRIFPNLVLSTGATMEFIKHATMTIQFDLTIKRPAVYSPEVTQSPFVCEVNINDDRGKQHQAIISDWW